MGKAPLERHATSLPAYTEIPLGSVDEFTFFAHCVDSIYPTVRIYVRASTAGGILFASDVGGNAGAHTFTLASQVQVHNLTTTLNVPVRFGQYSFTVVSANGQVHDVRGIAYAQRAEAGSSAYLAPGRACGLNQVSILKASR